MVNMRSGICLLRRHHHHHQQQQQQQQKVQLQLQLLQRQLQRQSELCRSVATVSAVQLQASSGATSTAAHKHAHKHAHEHGHAPVASHPTTHVLLLSPLLLHPTSDRASTLFPTSTAPPTDPASSSLSLSLPLSLSHPSKHQQLRSNPPASGWKKCIVSSTCASTTTTYPTPVPSSTLLRFATTDARVVTTSAASAGSDGTSAGSGSGRGRDRSNRHIPDSAASSSSSSSSSGVGTTGHSNAGNDDDHDLLLRVDMDELRELATKRCTPLSLKDMYKYAVVDVDNPEQRLWNAQFLHKELPIRMAQRAYDLLTLPHGLNEAPAILQVARVYLLYLEQFQDCPVPETYELEDKFTDMLQGMVLERSSIPNAIARGVDDWMEQQQTTAAANATLSLGGVPTRDDDDDENDGREDRLRQLDDALYRFFTARVGLRFLTEHHILSSPTRASSKGSCALRKSQSSFATTVVVAASPRATTTTGRETDDDAAITVDSAATATTAAAAVSVPFLGCIQTNCEPALEVRKVVDAVRRQTEDHYGMCPDIHIVEAQSHRGRRSDAGGDSGAHHHNFTYVPHHLHYMVSELVKNSCRATVKRHMEKSDDDGSPLGAIKVVVVKGAEDVTIKVADRGGGIPRSKMSKIWRFAHSTTAAGDDDDGESGSEFGVDESTGTQIRGFGLPLVRIYARYLGGELTLRSMEGYGVDAYLHLPRLGDACENLPLPVKFSPSNLSSNAPRGATTRN